MRYLTALSLLVLGFSSIAKAQSKLLESVKRNPEEAKAMCVADPPKILSTLAYGVLMVS